MPVFEGPVLELHGVEALQLTSRYLRVGKRGEQQQCCKQNSFHRDSLLGENFEATATVPDLMIC